MKTFKEAFELYSKVRPTTKKAIEKLRIWDSSLTLRENSEKLDISIQSAAQFKTHYRLECKKIRGWILGPKPASLRVQAFVDLNEKGWPFSDIARLFRVSRQCVQQAVRKEKSRKP